MHEETSIKISKKPFYRRDPLTSILATIGVVLASQVVAVGLLGLYPALRNWTDLQIERWLEGITAQFMYISLVGALSYGLIMRLLKSAKVTKARIGWARIRLRDFGMAAVAYGLYFISYFIILLIVPLVFPELNLDQEQQIGFEQAYTDMHLLLTFISLVIIPPLVEELIFRGFLFTSLRAKFRLRYAVIITSILFGVLHLQFGSGAALLWVAALDTFILSCFLCMLRERSGSLWPPILLHAGKNSIAFMVLFGSRIFS